MKNEHSLVSPHPGSGECLSVGMIWSPRSQFPESIARDAGGARPAPVHSFPFLGLGFPEMGKVHKNFKYSMCKTI